MIELVVARHNESGVWLHDQLVFIDRVSEYDKGKRFPLGLRLPNVGREAHTYLMHIVERWGCLATTTIFCQGDPRDHLARAEGWSVSRMAEMFAAHPDLQFLQVPVVTRREWDDHTGKLLHWGKWAEALQSGEMSRARVPFVEWFLRFVGIDLRLKNSLTYAVGATFGVARDLIRRNPRGLYENLLEQVSHATNPEEAYYLERAWPYLFSEEGLESRQRTFATAARSEVRELVKV